jgi:HTH-type transcriptional regulator/antitoxin HigA
MAIDDGDEVMARSDEGVWSPNWATHPGDHLAEYIEVNGWSQAEFARIADLSSKLVSTIVARKNPVTPETAIKLERVLGLKAQIWLNLQTNWDLHEARSQDAKRASSESQRAWAARFPLAELKARGALPNTSDESATFGGLLSFLSIGSPDAFEAKLQSLAVQHRQARSHPSSPFHVYSWLKLGEDRARAVELPSFDQERFLSAIQEIRGLTTASASVFEPRMMELCREAGVALVFEKPISKTCLYGSARWLDNDHAVIQMSLRMKTNDHFWWTFFHEAAHIALHRGTNFMDDKDAKGDGAEAEADLWAQELLVGRVKFREFAVQRPRSEAQVTEFASEVGIHPGIIVGMLQHEGFLPFSHLNGLKAAVDWPADVSGETN